MRELIQFQDDPDLQRFNHINNEVERLDSFNAKPMPNGYVKEVKRSSIFKPLDFS
jgi:hypothetical protein